MLRIHTWQTRAFTLTVAMCVALPFTAEGKRNPLQETEEDDFVPPPYIELAEQAIVEGDLGAAVRVLKSAQACWSERFEKCGFTRVDFDSLAGVVYLEHGLAEKAARSLESVVAEQPNRTMAWFYLGQAYMRLSQYEKAARALKEAASVGRGIPRYHAMSVKAWMGAKEPEKARRALQTGLKLFPENAPLLFEGANLFLSEGLFLPATEFARRHALAGEKNGDLAFLVVAEAHRAGGCLRDAIVVLEEARLICGDDSNAAVRLAYIYSEAGEHLSAARLFEQLLRRRPDLAFATSEQYRLAEHFVEALRPAALIEEEDRRRRQLAAIYLQMDAFDTVVQVLLPLAKGGYLEDQERYRMAYAALRAGRLEMAGNLLKGLRAPSLKAPAAHLIVAMKKCQDKPWHCW